MFVIFFTHPRLSSYLSSLTMIKSAIVTFLSSSALLCIQPNQKKSCQQNLQTIWRHPTQKPLCCFHLANGFQIQTSGKSFPVKVKCLIPWSNFQHFFPPLQECQWPHIWLEARNAPGESRAAVAGSRLCGVTAVVRQAAATSAGNAPNPWSVVCLPWFTKPRLTHSNKPLLHHIHSCYGDRLSMIQIKYFITSN